MAFNPSTHAWLGGPHWGEIAAMEQARAAQAAQAAQADLNRNHLLLLRR